MFIPEDVFSTNKFINPSPLNGVRVYKKIVKNDLIKNTINFQIIVIFFISFLIFFDSQKSLFCQYKQNQGMYYFILSDMQSEERCVNEKGLCNWT